MAIALVMSYSLVHCMYCSTRKGQFKGWKKLYHLERQSKKTMSQSVHLMLHVSATLLCNLDRPGGLKKPVINLLSLSNKEGSDLECKHQQLVCGLPHR